MEDKKVSLPLRECGLKLQRIQRLFGCGMSLPLRECGLKSKQQGLHNQHPDVTPLAGVWIEINNGVLLLYYLQRVTPLAGVWIEMP